MSSARRATVSIVGVAIVLTLTPGTPAHAAWSAIGSGSAAGMAISMPTGFTPSGQSSGSSTTVSWTPATLSDGTAVAGYVIRRYDAVTNAQESVGGDCGGVVTTTTCTELSVPSGTWVYTDTPVQSNWTGGASQKSAPITVT